MSPTATSKCPARAGTLTMFGYMCRNEAWVWPAWLPVPELTRAGRANMRPTTTPTPAKIAATMAGVAFELGGRWGVGGGGTRGIAAPFGLPTQRTRAVSRCHPQESATLLQETTDGAVGTTDPVAARVGCALRYPSPSLGAPWRADGLVQTTQT